MTDERRKKILFTFVFIATVYSSNGCWMEGVDIWALQQSTTILDTHRGAVFDRATRDIDSITSFSFMDGLNAGPYLTVTHSNSRFIIATNDAFQDYEEYETAQRISVTVNFRCSGGTTSILVVGINVQDTNNNAPRFQPSNEFVYTIFTPVPPGITVSGCFDGINVRDIDLTTERIDFAIEENPYFEIAYDAAASTTVKEFIGIIRTTTFIRTLPEAITLKITATDVDRTNDPPRTTTATITIKADTEFEFPEEPVFTQAFYLSNYVNADLVLPVPISLRSGFDELVVFSLQGELAANFELIPNGNQVTVSVVTPLATNVLRENRIFLVVRADREYTSGDSATIVVQLPEEVPLEFERAHYEGTIENNLLRVPQLTLARGYEGESVTVQVFSEYSSYFTPTIQENTITLSMAPLTDSIINENNVISLEIVASTEFSTARTIVSLEIIKDDIVTPVFNKPMYTGSYDIETGLTLEPIVFDQGYDETVELSLEGDHAALFTIRREGPILTLTTTALSPELFSQQRILLTLRATKPRTVGANTAIIITLPAARQLSFEESTYRGTLQDNILSFEPIVLSAGYDGNVDFLLRGELASYFSIVPTQNQITMLLARPILETFIQENNLIILTVEASGRNAITATTTALVDIIKKDITTPVFSHNIYYGTYQGTSTVNIENINLAQGYDKDVTFELQGEHAQYFQLTNTENNVVVALRSSIPENLIFNEKVLLFNVVARKPLTVGANAAISISFPSALTEPTVMRFAQNTYEAVIENNSLRADNIVLSTGYQAGIQFILTGDYSSYFTITDVSNVLTLSLIKPLPVDVFDSTFIVLEVEARRERAISVWTSIVIDVVKQEVEPLVFSRPYYRGVYNEEKEMLSVEVISLEFGYGESVKFQLEGDLAPLFSLTETSSNRLTIAAVQPIPSTVLADNSHLLFAIVANKPDAITAKAAISIDINRVTPPARYLRFTKDYYTGSIDGSTLTLDAMSLDGDSDDVTYRFLGDYADYFQLTRQGGTLTLRLLRELPPGATEANNVLIYTLEAQIDDIRAHTTIILEIIKDPSMDKGLTFEEIFYIGSYSAAEGLLFDAKVRINEELNTPVTYTLHGTQAEWFYVVETGNTISLAMSSPIPSAILESNHQLVFAIKADSPGFNTATATIVITIVKDHTIGSILGFDQVTYVGSIQDTAVTLKPITLIEGFTQEVAFTLHGDLSRYFSLSSVGGVVTITMPTAIPDQNIPANRLIVLEIRASVPQALTAYATIVFEVVVKDDQTSAPQLVFDATYYTGSYTTAGGLIQNAPISLAEGFDQTVAFALEGDQSQWFSVVQSANSVTLTVASSIPAAVLANNAQLVFAIAARRPGSVTARATIVISLTDDHTGGSILGFDQVTYVGSIQDTAVTLEPITLIEGFTQEVAFTLHGDLSRYFSLSSVGGFITITMPTAIPDQNIPANRLIVLEIRASAPQALTAYATVVFEVVVKDDQPSAPQLVFDATYYTGSYTTAGGLIQNAPISLAEGFDQTVAFALEGDQSQWFSVVQSANSVTLTVASSIPAAVLANNAQLVFAIAARRPGSVTARATIVISLTDDHTGDSILGFDQVTYVGSIQDTAVTLKPITLIEGFTQEVAFTLHGDLSRYFSLSSVGGVVTITMPTAIPDQNIPANRLIVLEIRASVPQALTAYATIVFEVVVKDDQTSAPQLVFDATYYTGSYTTAGGLIQNAPISLAEGFDQTVAFALEGDQSQWFSVVQSANSVTLTVTSSIPAAVLANNAQLVFAIAARRPGSVTARATIVISLTDDHTGGSILGFDQVTYVGSIQDTAVTLEPITLIEGFTQEVAFTLHGDLSRYFSLSSVGGFITITMPTAIPDQNIPANRLIVLEIRASAPQALTAYATVVFEVVVKDDQPSAPQLVFDATYYTGSYTTAGGLIQNAPISLAEGFDQTVAFALEGDQSQWFSVVQSANSVTLTVASSIPAAVLANNAQLVFAIAARRPGSVTARATIVISLTDDHTGDSILGFDQVTYVGSIQDTAVTLEPITLIEGFTQEVAFTLHGDLSRYFSLSSVGGVITITMPTAIPDQNIPANRLIVLEIRASAPQALTAYATVVFEVVVKDDQPSAPQLVFDATYYTGSYTTAGGLIQNAPISLAEGFDQTVAFALEGDQSQWFSVVQSANSVTLTVASSIPAAVLANNAQLVFAIAARRPGSVTARATIVISLTDDHTGDSILGFDQVTYVGSIQDTAVTLKPITLIEGFTQEVAFTLHGDLSRYFSLSSVGGVVTITMPTAIPDQNIPANRLIVLEIRASVPQALTAYATIVFEVVVKDDQTSAPQLVFDATYYTGSYTTAGGLIQNAPISLAEGFDQTVAFALEGDQSQWFSVVQSANSVTLTVTSSIPAAVLANNAQLVFAIAARRPGSVTARATIVISLTDDHTGGSILGFDQVTYVGSIQDKAVTLEPITLIEGFTQEVAFTLHGDLSRYFSLSSVGGFITITMPTAIPDQNIPANRLIVLEIRASAPQALTAYATVVFEVVVKDDQPSAPQLVFDATYYTGSYTTAGGLIQNAPISLAEGFDQTVAFALEGDQSQWFSVVQSANSVTLTVASSIPAAVLANNAQLVFAIAARRPGSVTARATIVISLTDDHTGDSILGFDQVTYVGSIQDTAVTLEPITLIEGFTQEVAFTLHGDLSRYFSLSSVGGVITITMPTAIPDQNIPANRLIVLEIRASAPQALTAYATVVFEVVVKDDQPSAPQLVFDATYYTGSYTTAGGLIQNAPISLAEGFDQTVAFALEGDQSHWFFMVQSGNSVTLIVISSIPAAVLANNAQLVFAIAAWRPGSVTARATIIISLTDDHTGGSILGFDQVTYLGSIQDTTVTLEPITLIEGFTQEVAFTLHGDLSRYFSLSSVGSIVTITMPTAIPDQNIPANRLIVLEIRASAPQALTAYATIVFEVVVKDDQPSATQLVFDATYYTGSYTTTGGLIQNAPISLAQGFDESVAFALEGDQSHWFFMVQSGNSVTLIVISSIPAAVLANNAQLVFAIAAWRPGSVTARATIVISLTDDLQTGDDISFEKLVYEGIIQLSTVQHESITLSNYNGVDVQLHGELSSLFVARVVEGVVTVQASGTLSLPDDVSRVILELHAADARAILLLTVVQSDVPVIPLVTFSSPSYALNVDIVQTGLVGRVLATADNGEAVAYSLAIENAHLQARVSINNEGELHLSAPANSGVYSFQVIATTVITRAKGTATIYLTVEAVTVCGDDKIVVPPLIILDRDEEEPHSNLVTLNAAQFEGCRYTLTNRWPLNQNWLYVDENGLHARSIDREHESIAFMALSQVQVELILHCESDNAIRTKRSQRTDWLGPYDYGSSKWILTESIPYNARRSLVNLIVNDINDNAPIFVGKESEPIAVGYPTGEVEERILPRSLVELQATDADIGLNAALRYWSSEEVLAVAPTTGFVHVRSGAQLRNDQRLTVSATDQNGQGLTGNIQLLVKLLDSSNIVVVTVKDAFLDDEKAVLTRLSNAVGYEVKVLRSVVVSDGDQDSSRKKRDTSTTGASLLLYVYGLIQREPVTVDRLTTDINNNAAVASVISTVSLEDHLEPVVIPGRDIGFMVATIVLSVLLFIIIVLIAIWYFLRWRKNKSYNAFTDENSMTSRGSVEQLPKPESPKPRLNLEELKRSEKRLQDMLNSPIDEITVEPITPRREAALEAKVDFSSSEPSAPIVIQSIDKLKDSEDTNDDEFGEKDAPRRKSVVTFNENVEKIIHVEDDTDTVSSISGYEIYKL